ncbi:MAG: YopX family protein [Phycisphaerae bacterium]|jgi:hypothetical protein
MKEIKFRGIEKNTNTMVYGSLINNIYFKNDGSPICYIFSTKKCEGCEYSCDCNEDFFTCEDVFLEVKSETLTQSSEIKDCNNKNVFPGDIIRIYPIDKDSFIVGYGMLFYFPHINIAPWMTSDSFEKFEVIGNIFENPEIIDGPEHNL